MKLGSLVRVWYQLSVYRGVALRQFESYQQTHELVRRNPCSLRLVRKNELVVVLRPTSYDCFVLHESGQVGWINREFLRQIRKKRDV